MYGHFSRDNREYVIEKPDTPTPWINYLSNTEYCAMISNTGGGYSFHIDPRDRRITRYRYNSLPVDRPGRYIYIRDDGTGSYWSPTWQPTLTPLDSYECRHGLGYTRISSSYSGVEAEVTYFVPVDTNLEVWMLTLKNISDSKRQLKVFTYSEFCLWQAARDQNDLQSIQFVGVSRNEDGIILYHLHDESTGYAFFASSKDMLGYDCVRETFIGPYRSETNPVAVEKGECQNSVAIGGNPIAATAIQIHLDPGESDTIVFVLGVAPTRDQARELAKKLTDTRIVNEEFRKLQDDWNSYLDRLVSVTPDLEFDAVVNVWNQYQCRTTFRWSRYVSFYETGIGRGMGFRDCSQDILGVLHVLPGEVRQRIIDLARNQFKTGRVYHIYFPLSGEGGFPDYVKKDMQFFSDDHLWIILAVSEYIRETGDFGILNEKVNFVDGPPVSLYRHLKKSIDFTLSKMGNLGLTLLGTADWNDPMSLPGPNNAAESVFSAMLFHKVLRELAGLSHEIRKSTDAQQFSSLADQTRDHLNEVAWDGSWYIRAFTDCGDPLGTSKSREGRLFVNAQSWSVISGVATKDRGVSAMDSVKKLLDTEYGIMLLGPAFAHYRSDIGTLSGYAPGLKENASIWSHANAWAIIAESMLGRGDQAYEYYKKLAPPTKNKIAEIHRTEPYVYAQTIAGKDHPTFGMAKQSWLTGTAAWMLKAASSYILGVQPQYHGLSVDPCVPRGWNQFKVKRQFRNAIYDIEVRNPDGVSSGVKSVSIEGRPSESKILPVFADGGTHKVTVTMG